MGMPMQREAPAEWNGVQLRPYHAQRGSTAGIHPWVGDFETKVIRGEACFRAALKLRAEGFQPDVIVAHHGWGESLFLKEVWPKARLGVYCEFFYKSDGADSNFDPEFPSTDPGDVCRLQLKNVNNLMHFDTASAGLSPTHWQASTFPKPFRSRISVAHDGIDTAALAPNPSVQLQVKAASGETIALSRADEVITFVNRNLEPYRGFHTFMRALPELLRRRPHARVLMVGGDGVSYGARPNVERHGAATWKEVYTREVRPQIPDADWERVHFLGHLPYQHFVPLLQLSRVHVYLTYPFVLSWSLLEAMSVGCSIVASNTAPLREAIEHDRTGRLVDFFSPADVCQQVCELLDDEAARNRLGQAAREFARATYDLQRICLPQQLRWVEHLAQLDSP
jgi:glycosyltransferase involved in cell wall biosynthesis